MNFKPKTVTFPIIGITISVFILQVILGDWFTQAFMLTPSNILSQPWILITSAFLHGSVSHLFFNMYALMIFGPLVEATIGKKRFLGIYLVSELIASFGYSLFYTSPALGASGAIMGILGMVIILYPNLKVLFLFFIPMSMRTAGIIFALFDLFGIFNPTSNVAHLAHLFGLTAGLFYGQYLLKNRKKFYASFNQIKKYSNESVGKEIKKKNKENIQNADFTYSEQIKLTDDDINNYLKHGRL